MSVMSFFAGEEHDNSEPDYNDPFRPPAPPRVVHCIHCGNGYSSARITWDSKRGLWSCPIADCDGAGYGFDIHDGNLPH
jgi:hypothetical protein